MNWLMRKLGYVRIADVEERMKIANQALLEVAHAQNSGASWYTRGERGLYEQVAMWVRRGLEATKEP